MASLASVTPMARMVLASLDLVASMVWVTDINRRKLCNVMLKFPPLKTWICSWTKQADPEARDGLTLLVKKELMGSQIWSVVVTWAMMASMASMVASMASMASMESKEAPMASLASVTPVSRMALASLDLVASMVWVTDLNRRKLCNVMLKFPPLKTWICSLTKQAWDAEGSRSSRRVDDVNVKKELMGSQIWSVVVTWASMVASTELMVASRASMDAPMASLASVAPTTLMALASAALVASRIWVSGLSRRKLSNEMLRFSPMENWLSFSTKQTWVDADPEVRDGLALSKRRRS